MQTIDREEDSLQKLQSHCEEIQGTLETLRTLPEKISHDVMVPFGSVAMFPGMLHSSESVTCSALNYSGAMSG
jgi:prefoldin subunit 5